MQFDGSGRHDDRQPQRSPNNTISITVHDRDHDVVSDLPICIVAISNREMLLGHAGNSYTVQATRGPDKH